MKQYREVINNLTAIKLNGILASIDEEINEAEKSKSSYLTFLNRLLDSEMEFRASRRLKRNLTGAHFPVEKTIEDFNFGRISGINKSDVANLMDFRWLDNRHNILFFGPPGLGKTHLSIAIGMKAIQSGYKVYFERITNLIKLLKTSEIQRRAGFRINRIMKANLLIIDEIGYTPIDRKEANLFFNLVSELYEQTSIIITSIH